MPLTAFRDASDADASQSSLSLSRESQPAIPPSRSTRIAPLTPVRRLFPRRTRNPLPTPRSRARTPSGPAIDAGGMAHHRSLGFDKETARNALLSARNDTALAVEYAIHDTHDPEDEDDECPVCVGRTENALMRRWLRDQGVRPRSAVVRAEERQEAEAEVEGEASTSTLARGGPALVPQHAERPATAVRVRTVNPFVTTGSTRSASLQRVLMPIPRFDNTPAAARTATLSDPNSNDPKGSLPTRGSSRVFSTVYPWARIDVQQSAPAPSISASNIGRAI